MADDGKYSLQKVMKELEPIKTNQQRYKKNMFFKSLLVPLLLLLL